MSFLRFRGIMSAPTQHQISTFPVNKVACSLLSENGEIKLSALKRLPQKHLANRLNMEPPSWQKINQIQNGSDKAQNTRWKLRETGPGFQPYPVCLGLWGAAARRKLNQRWRSSILKRLSSTETVPLPKKIVAMGCIFKKHFNMEVRKTAGRRTEADTVVSVF